MSCSQTMSDNPIYITEFDMDCLRAFLVRMSRAGIDGEDLRKLEEVLACAYIVGGANSENEVVTLDSVVRLRDLDFNREYLYTLVLPLQADLKHRKVSVLAPIGRCMLGRRVGDVFEVEAPAWGFRTFRIEGVYQLEDEETSDGTS